MSNSSNFSARESSYEKLRVSVAGDVRSEDITEIEAQLSTVVAHNEGYVFYYLA
jgi:hypothetical protein